jgi:sugar lactone lactonase YvrE
MSGRLWILTLILTTLGAMAANAETSIALPGDRVFPENIAASNDGAIYVGSIGEGGVYRVEPHVKEAKVWIKPGTFGTHSIFGVLADDKSNTLWVCSNDLTARGVTIAGSDGVSALKGFDLKSGEGRISAQLPTNPSTCNDVTIGPDGAAYVSNTSSPQISFVTLPGAH